MKNRALPWTFGLFNVLMLAAAACMQGCTRPHTDYWVDGIEVVQAVQTSIVNSVPLVANKPTFVRVYLASDGRRPWKVNARLIVKDVITGKKHEVLPSLPWPISVSPGGSHRNKWVDSFVFWLSPGDTEEGQRIFEAHVFESYDPNPPPAHTWAGQFTFHSRVYASVFGVVWSVTKTEKDGSGVTLVGPAAPWSDFYAHSAYVANVYPVTNFFVQPIPGIGPAQPNPQTFGNLTESRIWASQMLANLPSGSKINLLDNWDTGGLHGYAWGEASEEQNVRDNRVGKTMAQEVAHNNGIWCHTFDACSNYPHKSGHIDFNDVGYDLSGDLGRSDIQLVSFDGEHDLSDGLTAVGPVSDFMSYNSPPLWVSSYTYCQLISVIWKEDSSCIYINTPEIDRSFKVRKLEGYPFAKSADQSTERATRHIHNEHTDAYLFLSGDIDHGERVKFDRFEVIPSRENIATVEEDGDLSLELQDRSGTVLKRFAVSTNLHHLHESGDLIPFSAVLPLDGLLKNPSKIVAKKGGVTIGEQDLSQTTPKVVLENIAFSNDLQGTQRLHWSAASSDRNPLHFTVLYSADGNVWWPIHVGLTQTEVDINVDNLPGTEKGYFKVRASNFGKSKESGIIGPYRIARKPPLVAITQPLDGTTVQGPTVVLRGQASSLEEGVITNDAAFTWTDENNRELGRNTWVIVRDLKRGPHQFQLKVKDAVGKVASASVRINVEQKQLSPEATQN
jgi:hypothetical protein